MKTQFILTLLSFMMLFSCRSTGANNNPDNKLMKKVSCADNAYFIQNICEDELEYLKWAEENYPDHPHLNDLTQSFLQQVTHATKDVDKAAALFYNRTIREPRNRNFIEFLENYEKGKQPKPDYSGKNILLALVPGMFYKDNHDQVDSTGQSIRSVAKSMGIRDVVVPTEQTGTVTTNGTIVCRFVEQSTANHIILASASKGSADVKVAISICGNQPYFRKVIGWFNIGGILKGSLLVNNISASWYNRLKGRISFFLKGYNWNGLMSIKKTPDAPLHQEIALPDTLLVINVIGVPLFRHVIQRAWPYYLYLTRYGPNDGMVLLSDSYIRNAITYSSFRNDHYFQWPFPDRRIEGFLEFILKNSKL